jgi:proline dehydrogenase
LNLLRQTLLFLSQRQNLEEFLKQNPLALKARRRFVAGNTRDEALVVTRKLNQEGFAVTLDFLGEEVTDLTQAEAAAEEYAGVIEEAAGKNLDTGISVKLSHLGVRLDRETAREHLTDIVRRAAAVDRFVRVDMEGADLAKTTLEMVEELHRDYKNIGAVIQAYLRRSDADIKRLNTEKVSVRLVKGAYLEPEEIAFQGPGEVALYYMRLTERLIYRGTKPAFATHDETLIEFVIDLSDIFGFDKSNFEFQMLYGIRRDLQRELLKKGYRVRVYLPYGEDWYGYFMRRLAERPANLWFLLRHLKE